MAETINMEQRDSIVSTISSASNRSWKNRLSFRSNTNSSTSTAASSPISKRSSIASLGQLLSKVTSTAPSHSTFQQIPSSQTSRPKTWAFTSGTASHQQPPRSASPSYNPTSTFSSPSTTRPSTSAQPFRRLSLRISRLLAPSTPTTDIFTTPLSPTPSATPASLQIFFNTLQAYDTTLSSVLHIALRVISKATDPTTIYSAGRRGSTPCSPTSVEEGIEAYAASAQRELVRTVLDFFALCGCEAPAAPLSHVATVCGLSIKTIQQCVALDDGLRECVVGAERLCKRFDARDDFRDFGPRGGVLGMKEGEAVWREWRRANRESEKCRRGARRLRGRMSAGSEGMGGWVKGMFG